MSGTMGRQEVRLAVRRRVRHVHFSVLDARAIPPPAGPSTETHCPDRLRRERTTIDSASSGAREVHEAGTELSATEPSGGPAKVGRPNVSSQQRRSKNWASTPAAIDVGDAAYRRLRERLTTRNRLAVVRLTLSQPKPARRWAHASKHETEAVYHPEAQIRQPSQVMRVATASHRRQPTAPGCPRFQRSRHRGHVAAVLLQPPQPQRREALAPRDRARSVPALGRDTRGGFSCRSVLRRGGGGGQACRERNTSCCDYRAGKSMSCRSSRRAARRLA